MKNYLSTERVVLTSNVKFVVHDITVEGNDTVLYTGYLDDANHWLIENMTESDTMQQVSTSGSRTRMVNRDYLTKNESQNRAFDNGMYSGQAAEGRKWEMAQIVKRLNK